MLRKRDKLIVRLQRLCSEYEKLVTESLELDEKNMSLKLSCDAVTNTLNVIVTAWYSE